ncbi:MAG: hypothetical protein AAGG68_22460 [Bacteroidota bacterium]
MMKQNSLFLSITLFFTLNTFNLQAQSSRFKSVQANSFDLIIGGDFGYRLIDGNTNDSKIAEVIANRERFENYKLNYRFGFNYYKGIGESLLAKIGIRFANPGFSTGSIEPIDLQQNINEIDKIYQQRGTIYHYNYQIIELPVGLRYIVSWSLCKPYVEAGVAPNIYWRTFIEEEHYQENHNTTIIEEPINRFNFIGFLATGGDFIISKHLSGFTQLVGRYQLNNLRTSELEERILSMGFEVGIRFYP